MSTTPQRIVRHDGRSWVVVAPGAGRVSYRSPDRGDAVARARRIVRNLGGGQIELHGQEDDAVERIVDVTRAAAAEPDLRPR